MVWRNGQRWKSGQGLRPRREDELSRLGRRLDWLVAQVTKYRDGWQCQRCGKRLFARDAHCAHVLPRSAGILLRWDRHNTILLCAQDHLEWAHRHPAQFREWFQAKFPARFAYLSS
jgi:5-methylcytosine-specific restriction endonuclease McrA